MYVIKIKDGQAVGDAVLFDNLRALFPQVSFPAPPTPDDVEPLGFGLFETAPEPACSPLEKTLRGAPVRGVDGVWRHAWQVQPMQGDELQAAQQVVKDKAWGAIKAHRDRLAINGGYKVVVDGADKWFHSDIFSRTQQIGLVMMGASVPVELQWKTMDGSFVAMTPALASAVFNAAAAQDQALFAAAEQHKATMEASADPGGYDFSGGWPATFQG